MRCEDVTRELAVPAGGLDPAELTEHLAVCSNCAEWGERSRQFDRLWDATRPSDPPLATWQTVWANVTRATEPATVSFSIPPRWRQRLMVVMSLAQAAALLIAGLAIFQTVGVARDVAQEGKTLFICLDDQGRRVDWRDRIEDPELLNATADEQLTGDNALSEVEPIQPSWDMEIINRMEGSE
jgi:hypothetical protein